MASPSLELDDQSDEDFFDKLVDDELDLAGSSTPAVLAEGRGGAEEASAIAGLRISGVEFAPEDSDYGAANDLGEKANLDSLDSLLVEQEIKSNGVVESESGKVKLVQWAAFGSESPENLNGSYSDLFGGLGESFDDPFLNLGKGETLKVQSSLDNVALVNSSNGELGSSTCDNPQEYQQQDSVKSPDLNSSQYWENAYPGWKFDPSTGQWYQLECYDANVSSNGDLNSGANSGANLSNLKDLHQISDSICSEQTSMKAFETENVSDWNRSSQGRSEYPAHMVFDPQYPGWYYDTISQEWKSLDSYNPVGDYRSSLDSCQQLVNNNVSSYGSQNHQDGAANWNSSLGGYNQQNETVCQSQESAQSVMIGYAGSQQLGNHHLAKNVGNYYVSQQMGSNQGYNGGFGVSDQFQSANNSGNFGKYHNQTELDSKESQFNGQNEVLFPQQPMRERGGSPFLHIGNEERKPSERPPHALVTFGFGGKLVVMKQSSSLYTNSVYETQGSQGGVINVLNLMDVVMAKNETSGFEMGGKDYFNALCQQSFPGPLVGGNAGSKELNKWIDDKIANCENSCMDFGKGELLSLLFSLLKIAVQHYGKLRSPFGSDPGLKENDSPESAVAKLFASAERNQYSGNMQCLQNMPSEAQIQATALEVQRLLVSGRKKEALELAQEGRLWGPALIIASQLGDQLYGDTMKKMALMQFTPGSPLRTLWLLISGHPAEVFSDAIVSQSGAYNSLNMLQQPAQVQGNSTLDEWIQNLAIITANRTKDDELVIIHLGDSLWKDTGEITAAHICYLVAEVNFEQHSDSARLCLIGADHWKFPRTYASPEAIQRTELYEYAKILGNSQFLLLPLQAYKLVYAHMLAEVGKISESLKYCQAILKCLKTGRGPELEAWKQLVISLEERIKTHQQGGYGTNLAPIKLVGKLLTFFDSTAHRVVGGLPPPIPSASQGSVQLSERPQRLGVPRVSSHQSTFSQSATTTRFLMPSASMEPISAAVNDEVTMPNRSNSEPDFSRSPRKADSSNNENSKSQGKTPEASGSRFGRFGSQLFQKTVGLVIKSGQDKQAKLGEANSFYYDEKLKRWVERGSEPLAEQEPLPPPPPTAAFHSATQDYNIHNSLQPEKFNSFATPEIRSSSSTTDNGPGVPPIPPGSNQFSARGRTGVRSRYVDTFNKGDWAAVTSSFRSLPPTQVAKKPNVVGNSNPKFFVPTPVISSEQITQAEAGETWQETTIASSNSSASFKDESVSSMAGIPTAASAPTPTPAMQRFGSMGRIVSGSGDNMDQGRNFLVPPQSRRTASWGGSLSDALSPAMSNPPLEHLPKSNGSFGDDLHEVQL